MNGFIAQAERSRGKCRDLTNPACMTAGSPDVMGYSGIGMVSALHPSQRSDELHERD